MYSVVEFKILPGLTLKVNTPPIMDFFSRNDSLDSLGYLTKRLNLEVEEAGGRTIPLLNYVVGEAVTLRKSLTGLRLIKGVPDYSGVVDRRNLTPELPKIMEVLRRNYKKDQERAEESKSLFDRLRGSNLCREILLPFDDSGTVTQRVVDGRGNAWETNQMDAYRALVNGDMSHMITRQATLESEEIARLMSSMAVNRDRSIYYVNSRYPGRSRSVGSMMGFSADFDGDLGWMSPSRTVAQPETPPTAYVDNSRSVAELDFAEAIAAAAEVANGNRGRPPASRGPRPRNQRW